MDNLLKVVAGNVRVPDARLLELGCGNGDLINAIADRHPHLSRIVAVDHFTKPVSLRPRVEFIDQDLERFSLAEQFDLIILNQVLEHVKNPLGLLELLKGNLAKHGRILIVVPNRRGFGNEARVYLPEHGRHYFLWDRESLEFSLNRIGFACRFYNLYVAASHHPFLKYLPALLRIQNPHLTCIAMPDTP